ncbi:MAG: NADH-quinone oxidoreductase subunit N [Longimicrobiaceae bacterium]
MTLDFSSNLDYFWALLPEAILSLWAIGLLLLDVFQKGERAGPSSPALPWLSLAGLALAAVANGWLLSVGEVGTAGMVVVDGFRIFANFIFLLSAGFATVVSIGYLDRMGLNRGEFHVLLLFATVGMMVMAGARDLMLIFLGLELMSISVYVLVGFNRSDPRAAEAALKYFLLGAFSTAFLLYGIALLFGATGTTNLSLLAGLFTSGELSPLLLAGVGLTAVGFGFKVAAVPFHMWTPDAYDGAPTPVTGFMATGVKAAAFAAFIRVFAVAFGGAYEQWVVVIFWLAALTMIAANLIALTQGSVKRMLAYSSIAHAGYLLVALAAANSLGAAAFLFYLVVYTLMTIGAFTVISAGDKDRIALPDYAGMGWEKPLIAALFSVFLLSLAGFPLTAGFIGKLYILQAALAAGLLPLAVILVVASLISYFYYLRVVIVMYMRPVSPEGDYGGVRLPAPALAAVGTAGAAVLLLFFFPGPLLDAARRSATTLFLAP